MLRIRSRDRHQRAVLSLGMGLVLAAPALTAQPLKGALVNARWRVEAVGSGRPAVLGRKVFFQTAEHEVVAVNIDDGAVAWRRKTGEPGASTEGSRVSADAGVVVVGDYDVFAFDAESGTPRWTFRPHEGYGPGYYLGDAERNVVVTGAPSGHVHAIELSTGKPLWTKVVSDDRHTTVFAPVQAGEMVVASYTQFGTVVRGGVVALSRADGSEAWRFTFPEVGDGSVPTNAARGPIVRSSTVFAASGDGSVWALDLATGRRLWRAPPVQGHEGTEASPAADFRALAISDAILVATSLTGTIVGLSPTSGTELWRSRPRTESPALEITGADGFVVVPFVSGSLSLMTAGGVELWQAGDYSAGLMWPAAVSGGLVFTGGRSGLWAIPTAGGSR